MLIQASRSSLLLIDLQTKLKPAVQGSDDCLARCGLLLAGARRLGLPVSATEHCPEKVGPTVSDLRSRLEPAEIVEKRHFNGMAEPALQRRLIALDRPVTVIGGMEAHVCVLQTALGLKVAGFEAVIVADAIASRDPSSKALAIARFRDHGIEVASAEMVLFEWLEVADTDAFADLLPMIKAGSADR